MLKITNPKVLLLAALCCLSSVVSAKKDDFPYKPTPYWFFTMQGGVQTALNSHFNNLKTIRPTASFSFGRFFNPLWGLRLNANGIYSRGAADHPNPNVGTGYFYHLYENTNLDALVSLRSLLGHKEYHPINLYLIGGLGYHASWSSEQAQSLENAGYNIQTNDRNYLHGLNGRVGLQFAADLHRKMALTVETSYNGHIASGKTCFSRNRNQFVAMVGLNFKFGFRVKDDYVPITIGTSNSTVAGTGANGVAPADTVWYDEDAFINHVEDGEIAWNVFYEIRESEYIDPEAQILKIGAFLKNHRECTVYVKSYADKGTGNPTLNLNYSKLRNEKAVRALVYAGVDPSIIVATYYGDTVQPFPENDKNRVTIITATGLKDTREKKTTRKFRVTPRTLPTK